MPPREVNGSGRHPFRMPGQPRAGGTLQLTEEAKKMMMMFITPKWRSPRAHARNTRKSTTDTRCPYTRTHICAPGAPLVQSSKGSTSGEKGWGVVWASG